MRIIAGIRKGMRLAVPPEGVRPTADRIREAIFSSLGNRVLGATVLDLFAGTGAIGLEAASRGASSVAFVENGREPLQSLQRNIETFQKGREFFCELSVMRADASKQLAEFAESGETFSIIFADPPYGKAAQALLENNDLPRLLSKDGLLVLESGKREALAVGSAWKLSRNAIYGDTQVSYLTKN